MIVDIIGFLSSFLFSACYVPQILQLYRTHVTNGISISLYWLCIAAYISAIIYTVFKVGFDKVLLLNYSSGMLLCSITIFMYYKFNSKNYGIK